jgi:polyhydroxybutyrate depolymerase
MHRAGTWRQCSTGLLAVLWGLLGSWLLVAEARASPCGSAGAFADCPVQGFADRPYRVFRPASHDPARPTPVVLVLHGGSGNAASAIDMSCPDGDLDRSACWHRVADRYGFVLVAPNGTRISPLSAQRVWNSGGGSNGWQCVSGPACVNGVDDVAYIREVLADLRRWMQVDAGAVFATGLSNGAALAHRLVCEMADELTAIAPVGGGNQLQTTRPCTPSRPVAILAIHGTADPCWTYVESEAACLATSGGRKIGIEDTMASWAQRYGCTGVSSRLESDRDGDGLRSTELAWAGCSASLRLLRIEGGGHTYPDGRQYMAVSSIGPTLRDWGAERIWGYFAEQAGRDEPHTGLWYLPGQEGWGLSITRQGDRLLPVWFTYGSNGQPTWLLVSGAAPQPDGSYAGDLIRYTGVPLASINGPASTGSRVVGRARFRSLPEDRLRFESTVEGLTQTRTLQRFAPGPLPVCAMAAGSDDDARNLGDVWWNPAEPGWGLHLTESDGRVFLAWFTYASNGEPTWLTGQLDRQPDGRYRGGLQQAASGTPFSAINGPATAFPVPTVGEAQLRLTNGSRGEFTSTLQGSTRTRPVERYVFDGPLRARCL